jgi:F-type H+-transporting ATPase subunit b
MADLASLMILAAAPAAAAHEAAEPLAFGVLPASWIVAASMAVLLGIAVWVKVPSALTRSLDTSIGEIKKQLEEAKHLRAEAEKLRAEYAARIANAADETAQMLDHARAEAQAIVAKAAADTTDVIARREKLASEKIEAAQRGAVAELRAKTADVAAAAARNVIANHYGADADKDQVDAAIGSF